MTWKNVKEIVTVSNRERIDDMIKVVETLVNKKQADLILDATLEDVLIPIFSYSCHVRVPHVS